MAGKLYARRASDEVQFDEFFQLASVGLLEAVDRYDPAYGASFRTYASHRIQGSILNGLEALTERARQVALRRRLEQERLESLRSGGGAEPPHDDAFERLASVAVGLALGFMLEDVAAYQVEGASYGDDAYTTAELRQLRSHLARLIGTLPEREGQILRRHYFQQVPFDQIAQSWGLTKGRISQLHHRALGLLRERLTAERLNLQV